MTTQKVEWPITIVQIDGAMWWIGLLEKKEFRAIPVMIPGSASGSRSRNETDSRPKKRKRWIAKAAIEPSTSEIPVATRPNFTESQREERTSGLCQATENQCVVQPGKGQLWMFDLLNAYTPMSTSGSQRKRTTRIVQTTRPMRVARVSIRAPGRPRAAGRRRGRPP